MNSIEKSNQGADVKKIPHKLHSHQFQKSLFKRKTSPMIIKNSLYAHHFQLVIHNKLNKNLKRVSNKILKSLPSSPSLSSLSLRYAYANIKEISFLTDIIKHLKRMTTFQLRILNETINLEKFNQLVGSLSSLTSLKSLEFAVPYENPTGIKEFKLTTILGYMNNLHTLSLYFGQGGVLDLENITTGLKALKNLAHFTFLLSFNGIFNKDIIALAECLARFKKLTFLRLDLSNNSVSILGLNSLLTSIKELIHLRHLDLALNKNMILAEELPSFKDSMSALTDLEVLKLNLSNLKIFQNSIKDFGTGLSYLKKLKVLQLSMIDCHLNEKHIVNLGKGISELTQLVDLDLDFTHNELYDKETLEFLECLRPLREIRIFSFSISRNLIGDWVLYTLSKVLSNYRNIEKIELDGFSCKLTDKGIENLGVVERLSNLKELILIFNKNNNIQDGGVKKLMEKLMLAKGLKEIRIDFAECQLSQELEDFYSDKLKSELPECHTTLLFGY